jgi:hypothetical protein
VSRRPRFAVIDCEDREHWGGHERSSTAAHEVFAVGDRALAIQGHPEMTRAIMIDRILPALRDSGRIDPDREAAALASMERPLDGDRVLGLIRGFLEGAEA